METNFDRLTSANPFEIDSILQWNENELDSYMQLVKNSTEVDYYAILNVPKDASSEQIKENYKKLCVVFHPDKHKDPSSKAASENFFLLIKKSYQILSDPDKRTLYDSYGPNCPELNIENETQLGPLLKTPEQIRAEYEERIRRENMLKLEKLISQRSHITATLDASPFLFPQLEEDNNEQRKPVKLDSLQLKYSTQSSLNDATSIGMIGKMFVHGQKGSGMVRAYAKKSFSPLTNGELSMNVVTWRDLHLKMSHVLDEKSHTMMKVDVHFSEYDHPPTFTMHLYRQLLQSRPLLGFVRFYSGYYRLGSWGLQKDLIGKLNKVKEQPSSALELGKHLVSSMTLGLQYTHLQHSVSVLSLQRSIFENTVSVYHQHRLGSLHSIDLALGLDFLSGGLMASWKWLFQLTEHVKAGLGVQLAHSGTVLAMDWERLGQRISLPIIVFPEPHIGIGFATTLLAVTVTGALSLGVYRPLKRLQRNKAFHFLKEQYKDLLLKRQREAKEASQLMLKIVQKKYIEEGKDGLLVLSAYYGCGRNVIDVTVPVMAFVEKSVLRLEGGRSKAMFIGFYDPCLGEKKNLEVTYYFRGLIRKTVVSDTAPLSCPLRSHELVPPGAVTVSPTVQEIFTVLDIDLTASDHLEEQTFLP